MMNARFFVKRPRMGSSNYWPYQSTLQDIEEGRNTLLKELSVKDWLQGPRMQSLAKSSTTEKIYWQLGNQFQWIVKDKGLRSQKPDVLERLFL